MKKIFILLSALLVACPGLVVPGHAQTGTAKSSLVLAQNGKTTYSIVVAEDAIPAEKTAARELSEYLEQISGAKFEVKSEDVAGSASPQILIGQGKRVKALLPNQNWSALKTDGILIKSVGQNLILSGGRSRGSLYAVDSFLEDSLGVRWWAPTDTTVPTMKTVSIPVQYIQYVPQFETREGFYTSLHQNAAFAAHLKNNGNHFALGPELGGKRRFWAGAILSMHCYLPKSILKTTPNGIVLAASFVRPNPRCR